MALGVNSPLLHFTEKDHFPLPSSIVYNLLEACREEGCPICRLEQKSVERYLDHHFYENVNSPRWRDRLRASLGFCREHAWLGVDKRLGDALGYSIIYRDILNSILNQLKDGSSPSLPARQKRSFLRQIPEATRNMIEKALAALTPHKHCPVCEHRDETTRTLRTVLVAELNTPEMRNALQASKGLCLPHLKQTLEQVKEASVCETLLTIHREKLESLKTELEEFIRKNDYQAIKEGFGSEGDAWLRAIASVVGKRGS
jgi:hypothetical protein